MARRLHVFLTVALLTSGLRGEPIAVSGIYPSLAMFNDEGECGTGAVVPWAGRLWVITYGPHLPFGSSDKLYEISPQLEQIIRPESVGGTPANRMIHKESEQLFIGPYVIDAKGGVRVIPPSVMPGRLTGNARHLSDPANKIYYATMEEGLYEVDVHSLAVTSLIRDGNPLKAGQEVNTVLTKLESDLPGYHGKGLYSGQGVLVYANNGDRDKRVLTDPATPSGALATWQKPGEDWKLVRRNQFTEVTGPGGLEGSAEGAPIWSIGWDHRSLILMCLDGGQWRSYRLPKGSHCYDGAHGWNTEWPRIRDVGEESLLMTMHGTMWAFPKGFSATNTAGVRPRSTYLKVIGDFARWGERIVFGCDDTAKSEFLNKNKAKGELAGPGRSQSNLWFVEPAKLDHLGPTLGNGAVWLDDQVEAGDVSDPFLFAGYAYKGLHVKHESDHDIAISVEVDAKGDGKWDEVQKITVPARGYKWVALDQSGQWVRLRLQQAAMGLTAMFNYRNGDSRPAEASEIFAGFSGGAAGSEDGLLRTRGERLNTLRVVSAEGGAYDLLADLKFKKVDEANEPAYTRKAVGIPEGVLSVDAASVIYEDEKGRWRLPGLQIEDGRVMREVCTERNLMNAAGTFYEMPAENAGGVAKMRPITTHQCRIYDYASYRGLMVMTGLKHGASGPHIVRSDDGKTSVWVGAVDDLWEFGKPRGVGGPWKESAVTEGQTSDPYLANGFDEKKLTITTDRAVSVTLQADITGTGKWCDVENFEVKPGVPLVHSFPKAFAAYWFRLRVGGEASITAQFEYR